MEHVHLAVAASKLPNELDIPDDFLENIHWLLNPSMDTDQEEPQDDDVERQEMVDALGGDLVAEWRTQVARLHHDTIAWLASAPNQIFPAVQGWNGPFIDYLCQRSGHTDPDLVRDLSYGFPMIREIPVHNVT